MQNNGANWGCSLNLGKRCRYISENHAVELHLPFILFWSCPKKTVWHEWHQLVLLTLCTLFFFKINDHSCAETTKHNRIDMEKKKKKLLKEVQSIANKIMQHESVRPFVNANFRLQNGLEPKNMKQLYQIIAYDST